MFYVHYNAQIMEFSVKDFFLNKTTTFYRGVSKIKKKKKEAYLRPRSKIYDEAFFRK